SGICDPPCPQNKENVMRLPLMLTIPALLSMALVATPAASIPPLWPYCGSGLNYNGCPKDQLDCEEISETQQPGGFCIGSDGVMAVTYVYSVYWCPTTTTLCMYTYRYYVPAIQQ